MDWKAELKNRINRALEEPIRAKHRVEAKEIEPQFVYGELYSIYKRSLPAGLNTPVLINLTEDEAKRYISTLFVPKLIDKENRVVHYYDIVKQDREHSIYENDGPLVKESVKDPVIILNNQDQEIKWED